MDFAANEKKQQQRKRSKRFHRIDNSFYTNNWTISPIKLNGRIITISKLINIRTFLHFNWKVCWPVVVAIGFFPIFYSHSIAFIGFDCWSILGWFNFQSFGLTPTMIFHLFIAAKYRSVIAFFRNALLWIHANIRQNWQQQQER